MRVSKKCTNCGSEFECQRSSSCWCNFITIDVRNLAKLPPTDDCFCRNCLLGKK